jgi:hypothetical protein
MTAGPFSIDESERAIAATTTPTGPQPWRTGSPLVLSWPELKAKNHAAARRRPQSSFVLNIIATQRVLFCSWFPKHYRHGRFQLVSQEGLLASGAEEATQ